MEEEFEAALQISKILIKAGADLSQADKEGKTALDFANFSDNPLVSDYLTGTTSGLTFLNEWNNVYLVIHFNDENFLMRIFLLVGVLTNI